MANHITPVVIPVIGGIIWSIFGHRVTFMAGAVIVAIDMGLATKDRYAAISRVCLNRHGMIRYQKEFVALFQQP